MLTVLVLADLVFLGLHLLYRHTQLLPSANFSLARDRGFAEFYQYGKELWIALLFLRMAIGTRHGVFGVFACLFGYFLIDDSFKLHENMGAFLAEFFSFPGAAGLRPVDLGELLVYGYFAVLFSIAIGLAYFRAGPPIRRIARTAILLVAGLALFGVVVDMLAIIARSPWLVELNSTVEEFGEMLVMSAITSYVFGLAPEVRTGDAGEASDSG